MATQAFQQPPAPLGSQPVVRGWDVGRVSAPRVIRDGDKYLMWYDGLDSSAAGRWAVGLAESPDGVAWTKYSGNPVLVPGEAGRWDEKYRFQVSVLKDGSTYEMWYSGAADGPWQTGYATSTNGIDWNVYADQPVLKLGEVGDWDELEADAPAVIKDGGSYEMWYHGCNADYKACGIGYATSANGTEWDKDAANPVLVGTPGAWDEAQVMWPAVVKSGSTYMMWYTSHDQIGLATSPDGNTWTKEVTNPVIEEGWNGGIAVQPSVLLEDGTYKMWFRSGPSGDSSIGYAESLDGIEWTLSLDNPVLTPGHTGYLPLVLKNFDPSRADIIFHNGVVLTMEANPVQVQAIAIRGSRILAVGSNAAILALAGANTQVIDLEERTLLPGFADGHTHVLRHAGAHGKTLDDTVDLLLEFGLTSVTEMSGSDDSVAELLTAEAEGRLRLRVNVFPSYNLAWLDEEGRSIYEGAWFPEHGPILDSNRRLRIPGIKIFADGAGLAPRGCPATTITYTISNTACFSDHGDLYLSQEDLNLAVADLQDRGFRVAFHTMGDRGIDTVLNAIEYALDGASNSVHRHQIQHSSFLRDDQITRYADLGILSSVRGTWNVCDQQEYEDNWPGYYTWWANRWALPGSGIHAYAEGDFGWNTSPYSRTAVTTVDPLMMLWGLVTRQQLREDGSACQPEAWVAEHQISVEQALRMLTIEPAYAVSQETVLGSLKAGKFADLVILSSNPKTVDPDALKDLAVLMTMVGGETEYCEQGYGSLCP
jgi:predicted amidohydrolase YtcJ/predicted GH43/DUF377 family glycosyl hydrolase